ncbi:hypothetical protein ABZ587_23590, partial [Streptomyces sp. NPDC018352]
GKLVRRVRRGAVRKRACTWRAPRRAAYPTNRLKQWCGIATRYEKTATIYLAGLHIAGIFLWSAR